MDSVHGMGRMCAPNTAHTNTTQYTVGAFLWGLGRECEVQRYTAASVKGACSVGYVHLSSLWSVASTYFLYGTYS